MSSDEKSQLVKDNYSMFECAPGIHILDETQEESPHMINEDEMEVQDVAIINDDNGQE